MEFRAILHLGCMGKCNAFIAVLFLLVTGVLLAACSGNNAAEQARADSLMRDSMVKDSIRKDGIADSVRKAHVKPYRKWATFKKDTLAYLKYNFFDRSTYYVRKPFIRLYNDLELKIHEQAPDFMNPLVHQDLHSSKSSKAIFTRITGFYFQPVHDIKQRQRKAYNRRMLSPYLLITFKQVHDIKYDMEIFMKYGHGWNYENLNLYREQIVARIEIGNLPDTIKIARQPERIIMRKQP